MNIMRISKSFVAAFAMLLFLLTGAQAVGQEPGVEVLSSFPQLVTGGDALVKVTDVNAAPVVTVGGTDLSAAFVADGNLLVSYFGDSDLPWTDVQKREVSGKLSFGFCTGPSTRFPNLSPDNCDQSVKAAMAREPERWAGVRCTYHDNLVNVYGIDPATSFARSPWDNVGVQYGKQAFNDGIITFEQFAELNARIGGHDLSGVIVPGRRARANLDALRIAYETGRLNTGAGGLKNIPILDVRGYTDGICTLAPCPPGDPQQVDVHDGYHTLVARAAREGQRQRRQPRQARHARGRTPWPRHDLKPRLRGCGRHPGSVGNGHSGRHLGTTAGAEGG